MSLQSKVALVTGSAGGLGKVTALKFLEEGAAVVVCDINDDLIEQFKQEIAQHQPVDKLLVLKADVTSETELDTLFANIDQTFGHLDIVINNAAIIDKFDPMGTMDKELWNRVIALNLTAPAFVTKRAVNQFLSKGIKGTIVNVASIASFRGFTCGAAYTASKHGVIGLTKNTAAFYGSKGIRCNAVMPGPMATNITNSLSSGFCAEGMQRMRVNFPAEADTTCDVEQVAGLIAYLSSDNAAVLNGATITADGGATAN